MSDLKKQLRPEIPSIIKKDNISVEEKFQNEVLRPIIKLQNDLIASCFQHYLKRKKVDFQKFTNDQTAGFIHKLFKSDTQLKTDLRSLIIGLFTLEEYQAYLTLSAQLNRRINSMIQERVTSYYIQKDK
jgi:flagellar biosynthesis regulator FlaF